MPELEILLAFIDPISAVGLGSMLFGAIRGGGGGPSDEEIEASEEMSRVQLELMKQIIPEIQRQQQLESLTNLRRMIATDPSAAQLAPVQQQAQALGMNASQLTPGAVPLQRAVNTLAFGVLPRFARSSGAGGGVFMDTPEQQALMQAAPRESARFGRRGFGQ